MKKLLLWFVMLSKRLYKKPTFLILMLLIPSLVLGYTALSAGDSGVITIGLASRGEDSTSQEIFTQLQSSELLSFQIMESPQAAEERLKGGKLDAVWIFPENMAEKVEAFAQNPTAEGAFITVLEREDSVALMLARERLNGAVYPYVAQRVYVHFLRELAPELSHLSDDKLLEYYHATDLSADLFQFEGAAAQKNQPSYLLSPLRGLLGTLILLCALATAMYYIRDAENGTFAWVSQRWQRLPELGCQLAAGLHTAIICLICLAACGLAGNLWTELAAALVYSLCCGVFAMALRQLFDSQKLLGAILPLVIVTSLVICPVFLDLGAMRSLQYLLPPTYYINATYNPSALLYMALYTAILGLFTLGISYVKSLFRR